MAKAISKHDDSWFDEDDEVVNKDIKGMYSRHTSEDEDEEGKEIWLTDEILAFNCREYAEAALEYFNNRVGGKTYELVEHGHTMAIDPILDHLNFKAKEKDCASAPVETFFAQLSFVRGMRVDCCVKLGPSHELPHWSEAELGGCEYCDGIINHPIELVDNLRSQILIEDGYYSSQVEDR